MEFSHNSKYARFPRSRHGTTDTPHRSAVHHSLKRAAKRRILSAALLACAAGALLGVSSLHAAESYWPGTERRFAPSIWLDGFHPSWSVSQMNNHWRTWVGPYHADWIDPSRGERVGMWFHATGLKSFYKDQSRRPANPTDPNDPNYDWGFMERALASDAVTRDGATINIRFDLEGGGMFPDWFEALGYTTLPPGEHKDIVDWSKPAAIRELKDLVTAFAKKYNDNSHLYTIAVSEQGGSGASSAAAKIDFYRHIVKSFDRAMLLIFQNAGVENTLKGIQGIGWGTADAKPFMGDCGSSGGNYGDNGRPLCDCGTGGIYGRAQTYASVASVPSCSGSSTFTVVSSEPNGMNIIGNSGRTPNPFGEQLPTSREMLPESDMTPAIYAWYHGYKPRGSKRSSGLGFNGAEDPAGIIPSHVLVLSNGARGSRPADWDRAFSTFGKAGTNAILWPPANFSPAAKPGPEPTPEPQPEPNPEPQPEPNPEPQPEPNPEPEPLPQSCPVVPAAGQTLFNACYNALGYTKPFSSQEKRDIKACEAACADTEVIPAPEPDPQPVPQPEPEPESAFGTPENFATEYVTRRSVKLGWKDVSGENGYTIQWRQGSTGRWRTLSAGADATSIQHNRLRRRTTYNYRICADRSRRQGGSSDWSGIISVRTR